MRADAREAQRPVAARGTINAAWVLASIAVVAFADWPTPIGRGWGVFQALFVLAVVVAQVIGLRRAARLSAV